MVRFVLWLKISMEKTKSDGTGGSIKFFFLVENSDVHHVSMKEDGGVGFTWAEAMGWAV
jgi:hypothetical protein